MELRSKLLEKIAFITRTKIEEHLLIVLDNSIYEEHLFQPIENNIKHLEIAFTFLTGYNGIFNVTNKNKQIHFHISF